MGKWHHLMPGSAQSSCSRSIPFDSENLHQLARPVVPVTPADRKLYWAGRPSRYSASAGKSMLFICPYLIKPVPWIYQMVQQRIFKNGIIRERENSLGRWRKSRLIKILNLVHRREKIPKIASFCSPEQQNENINLKREIWCHFIER